MELEEYTFKELLSRIVDNRGRTCPTAGSGTALIATNCIKDDQLYPVFEKVRWVDSETMKTWFRGHPEPGDILFVLKGSPGRCCLVPNPINFCIAQDMLALRADESKVSQKFLFALLRSSIVKNAIENLHVGTMIPHFKKGDFDQLTFQIPKSRGIQDRIGEIYFMLSNKIELNRKMNATLEAMAQALFKSWFVDFDPVIDNALAAGNPIPDALRAKAEVRRQQAEKNNSKRTSHLSAETAKADHSVFPSKFILTDEMGWIPEGWEVKKLRDLSSKISKGTTPRKVDIEKAQDAPVVPFIKVKDISDNGHLSESSIELIPQSIHVKKLKRSILYTDDVLFSIAGTIGRVTMVPASLNDSNANQAVAFIRSNSSVPSHYLLEHLRGKVVQDRIHSRIVQAVQANVSLTELGDIPTLQPSLDIIKIWKELMTPNYDRIDYLKVQNRTLIKLRDTLLPKLISGELRIEDAEKMVRDT